MLMSYPGAAAGQMGPPPLPEPGNPGSRQHQNAEDALTTEQKREVAKKLNEQRQQELKKDTDKLLQLATELKEYVDKTNENIMSMDVVKKAEQIEKLAKSVKDKMKGP
jgi:hypothetical protein